MAGPLRSDSILNTNSEVDDTVYRKALTSVDSRKLLAVVPLVYLWLSWATEPEAIWNADKKAIHGYRETERRKWNEKNKSILDRVRNLAFPSDVAQLAYVHILDITKEGYIKPHVDSVKFCGNVIAGLCLLSPCVMRVVNTKDNTKYGDVLLKQRSLYIMKDLARYNYTHEVLKEEESMFKGVKVPRDRRISVICRNEPAPEIT